MTDRTSREVSHMQARPESTDSLTGERLYESLRSELEAIDLDRDLDEDGTRSLMIALGVSASSGDEQRIGDEWIKLGVMCNRGLITSEQWLSMAPLFDARER